jgi:hypothetical protein
MRFKVWHFAVLGMAFCLAACGGDGGSDNSSNASSFKQLPATMSVVEGR